MADVAIQPVTTDCEVTFQPLGRRVSVTAGTTLLDAGRRAGLLLSAACGGAGVCGRCRVTVVSGNTFPPSEEEQEFLTSGAHSPGTRLACEARVASSVTIDVSAGSFAMGQRLQTDSDAVLSTSDPIIESHRIQVQPATLEDSRSDFRRASNALSESVGQANWKIHPRVASQLSTFLHQGRFNLVAFTRGTEIVGFADAEFGAVGLAVDLGCTKIAAYLVDLSTGTQLAAIGSPNPQITYGEDLITRLVYAAASAEQANTLARLVCECIANVADDLCAATRVLSEQIADVCIVGNTAMMHLLLNLPVLQMLQAPFTASVDRDIDIPARDLGWQFAPAAGVHILPSIGGFVGADHVAMILARDIDCTEKVTVGLDIGTNTEIVVRHPGTGKFLTTSVPSGPVFEGAHVADGMRAASGAIDAVYSVDGFLRYKTIDSAKPIGVCGSGMVDLLSELCRLGCINEKGHLSKTHALVRAGSCGQEVMVVPAAETGHGRDIVVTQHDITQVQLAKAAIHAGIETLLQVADISRDAVEQVVVAGAFGSYLDLRSAVAIGMLPRFSNAEYMQVGNAAGAGAKIALVSISQRERALSIARKAERIELKRYATFDQCMARSTRFPRPVGH